MHYSTQLSDRRLRPSREPARRPVHDPRSRYDRAIAIPYAREGAPGREIEATVGTRSIRAVSAFGHFASAAVPNLLRAVVSLIIAEAMAGCAAYAEAMYGIPLTAAEPQPADMPAKPGVSLTLVHTKDDFGRHAPPAFAALPARTAATIVAPTDEGKSVHHSWYVADGAFIAACRSRIRRANLRRRTVAELSELDERSLRDIGLSAADIEYFARCGEWRE
jgi:uncharacterized protein YjiS (DUF1127 family)